MKDTCCILAAGGLWGMISVFIRTLQQAGFTSMQCVAIRAFFTALVLLLYVCAKDPRSLRIHLRDIPLFVGTGIFSILLFNYCYFEAIEVIGGAAVPALLMYTAPIFVMILSAVLFHERITKHKLFALVLTFVGLGFVTGAFTGGEMLSAKAVFLGLGSGFGYALYSIFGKYLVDKYSSVTITFLYVSHDQHRRDSDVRHRAPAAGAFFWKMHDLCIGTCIFLHRPPVSAVHGRPDPRGSGQSLHFCND